MAEQLRVLDGIAEFENVQAACYVVGTGMTVTVFLADAEGVPIIAGTRVYPTFSPQSDADREQLNVFIAEMISELKGVLQSTVYEPEDATEAPVEDAPAPQKPKGKKKAS